MKSSSNIRRYVRSGAVAGSSSALVFAIIHFLFISDIWFSLVFMMAAGAICGLCIGWTFGLLFETPSLGAWMRYNMLYVTMFLLLGVTSVLVFEPVTSIAALVAANEPPDALIRQAMPMTFVFTLGTAILVNLLYGRGWVHFVAILVTCAVLVLLLGLNVSAIGLVYVPSGSAYLIVELFGLVLALNLVYLAVFVALERKSLLKGSPGHRWAV